ncbi:MAG: 4'-phosphopantetheinyl transferase superfamily protein [Firmicutes bacterium]|nr:4'-phosphopantetheinyl transferase superfamily protein [Bacillota bacterium]
MAVLMSRHFNNVMEIYIIEKYKERYPQMKGSELTDVLIKDCLEEYGVQDPQILRTTKGKPYVELCDTYLSVSHSGEYFLCIIAERPVGIDVQERKNSNSDKIAERYFTEREKSFIRDNGENGFFTVWTRKEAYSKLTGEGIAEIIRGTEVIGREDVVFTDFQLEDGVWCSYCIER